MQLTARNIGYMVKLGSSAFVTELSIAFMMFLGNYVFISHLGEDGVAAFSIACYFFPIIFMIYDAIVLSGQPILSYNFGLRDTSRIKQTLRLMYRTALLCGISFSPSPPFSATRLSLCLSDRNMQLIRLQ